MRNISIGLLINFLFLMTGSSQENLINPFYKQANFFNSSFEEDLFTSLQSKNPIDSSNLYLTFSNDPKVLQKKLQELIFKISDELEGKRHKNEMAYLRQIFLQIHKQYLKKYQRYSTFERVLLDGSYDCLTGTVLYAMVLRELGFPVEIHETGVHCYLKTYANQTPVLFESTDPLNGFITEPDIIKEREKKYAHDLPSNPNTLQGLAGFKSTTAASSVSSYSRLIGLKELAGLHYYNQAVISYVIKDYKGAVNILEKSFSLYSSDRIYNLLVQCIGHVFENPDLSEYEKKLYKGKINFYSKDLLNRG